MLVSGYKPDVFVCLNQFLNQLCALFLLVNNRNTVAHQITTSSVECFSVTSPAPTLHLCLRQDGKMALQGGNSRFVSADAEDSVVVRSKTAADPEMVSIRSGTERVHPGGSTQKEDEGNLNQVEINYV